MDETAANPRSAAAEDARLARAFLAGDSRAFEQLVSMHQDRIFNLCLWMLGDRQEADDAAQETFIKVYRSLAAFQFKSAFSTWLYRIAVNTCKTRFGSLGFRFSKKATRLGHSLSGEDRGTPLEITDPAPSQVEALENKQLAATIMQAIATLPKARRTVVVLRDVEGLSYEEIAAVTGYRMGTVKSRLTRGRRQLQDKLKGLL